MPVGKDTYVGSSEMRESLLSILKDVSPNEDNYFVSNLGKGPNALNTLHEWNTYYAARPTSVTVIAEGAATSYADLTAESRTSNYTAIAARPVRVSRTKASIAMVTGEDAVGKEKERALKNLKADMEYLTINGAGPSAGLSGVARGMAGIDLCISTNVTGRASGTSFTETELNDMVQESWTQVGSEYVADLLVAPVVIKRRVAGFGTNLTRNVQAVDKRLTQEVRVYDSQVGPTITVIAHKDVRATAGTLTAYMLREECFEHSFLTDSGEPHWEDRAKDGDYVSGTYITEFSLVSYAQRASVRRTGYNTGL
jgi:hypothetical protein